VKIVVVVDGRDRARVGLAKSEEENDIEMK
jgi:hypothetical protein